MRLLPVALLALFSALACLTSHGAVRPFTAPREAPWRMMDQTEDTAEVGRAAFSEAARPVALDL